MLAVQSQLTRLTEWQLTALRTQVAEMEDRQRHLVRFMQDESAFNSMLSLAMMRQLQRVAEMLASAAAEQEAQRARHLEDGSKLRRAERLTETLGSDERHAEDLRQLGEMIESTAKSASQASRKLTGPSCRKWQRTRNFNSVDKPGFGYRT